MDIKNIPKLSETQAAPEFEEQINRSSSNVASDSSGIASIKDSTEVYSGDSFSAVIRNSSADSPPMDLEPLLNDVRNFLTDQGPMNLQDPVGGTFGFMMEYQKMLNSENRQDRQTQRASGALELLSKDGKLNLDNEKIDAQMDEASEKYSQTLDAATTSSVIADVSAAYDSMEGSIEMEFNKLKSQSKQDIDQINEQIQQANEKGSQSMTEASTEYIIGQAGSLLKGDTQQDLHQMSNMLDALKQHASQIKDELVQNADPESSKRIQTRYQYLSSLFGNDDDK